jgi:hypothetical protein
MTVIRDDDPLDSALSALTDLIRLCSRQFVQPLLMRVLGESGADAFDISRLGDYFSDTQTPSVTSAEPQQRIVQTLLDSMKDRCLFVATELSHLNELGIHVGFGNAQM